MFSKLFFIRTHFQSHILIIKCFSVNKLFPTLKHIFSIKITISKLILPKKKFKRMAVKSDVALVGIFFNLFLSLAKLSSFHLANKEGTV